MAIILMIMTASDHLFGQHADLTNELSLLNGRLNISLPAEAYIEHRPVDIMSAPPSDEEETRIVYDKDSARYVLFVRELGIRTAPDIAERWRKEMEEEDYEVSISGPSIVDDMRFFPYAPLTIDTTSSAILIQGLLIETSEGLLIDARSYIDPRAARNLDSYRQLIDAVHAAIKPGNRKLELTERDHEFTLYDQGLVISLPAYHRITHQVGPDFLVYHITPIVALGEEMKATGIFYYGGHPSYFKRQRRFNTLAEASSKIKFLEIDAEAFSIDSDGSYLRESIVPMDDYSRIHIAVIGENREAVEKLWSHMLAIRRN